MEIQEINHADLVKLPKKEQRFWVKLTLEAADKRASVWSADECDYVATSAEIAVTVDPSEFLDYITAAEIIEAGHEHGLWSGIAEPERLQVLGQLDGVCAYEVDSLLDDIKAALKSGDAAEALALVDSYQNPKWKSPSEAEAAYKSAMGVFA